MPSSLLVLSCCGLLAAASFGAEMRRVGIYLDFQRRPSPQAIMAMQNDARLLLAPAGLEPVWINLGMQRGSEVFDSIMVVKFEGSCRVDLTDWRPGMTDAFS